MRAFTKEKFLDEADRPILWFVPNGFLAGYAKSKCKVESDFIVKVVLHQEWRIENDEKAYLLVEEAVRTEYFDPMMDYLIERGLPDWAIEFLRG